MRWAGEAVVIVASVFVVIYLEGVAQDRAESGDAHAALEQVLVELRADSVRALEISDHQEMLGTVYGDLLRWLGDPGAMPGDSVQAAIDFIGTSNWTLFPRKGAWRAMTSAGQLIWVDDQRLVTRLAHFYESVNARIEYNGRDYDVAVNEVTRATAPSAFDAESLRVRGDPAQQVAQLRGELRYIRIAWNDFYVDLLSEYMDELNGLLLDLDACMAGR